MTSSSLHLYIALFFSLFNIIIARSLSLYHHHAILIILYPAGFIRTLVRQHSRPHYMTLKSSLSCVYWCTASAPPAPTGDCTPTPPLTRDCGLQTAATPAPHHDRRIHSLSAHIYRSIPPAGTCVLCQHFGVFYCGYKRVSPSEPLSNNTGPLC